MPGVRSLLHRVTRLEQARAPVLSPFQRWYGSLDAFHDDMMAQVDAGVLDRTDICGADGNGGVLRAIRSWHEQRLYAR